MKRLIEFLTVLFVLLGSYSQVVAKEFYIYKDTKIKGDDGKSAKVFIGVPLKVKEELGEEVKIEIEGYMIGDTIYASNRKELIVAILDKGFKVSKKDANKVLLIGTVSKELILDNPIDIWEEHEEFYFEMCTQCHASPEVNHHSMVEWSAIFETMKGFAKLDEEENSYLLRYLKANSSDGFIKIKH